MCDSTANLNEKEISSAPILKLVSECSLNIPESRKNSKHQSFVAPHFEIAILDMKN